MIYPPGNRFSLHKGRSKHKFHLPEGSVSLTLRTKRSFPASVKKLCCDRGQMFTAPVLGIKQLAKVVFSKRVADITIHFQREESSNGRIVHQILCNHVLRSGVSQPTQTIYDQKDRHSPGRNSGGCCRATECYLSDCICILTFDSY